METEQERADRAEEALAAAEALIDASAPEPDGESAEPTEAADASQGDTATLGNFTLEVQPVDCANGFILSGEEMRAEGQYCVVTLLVTNNGDSPESLSTREVRLQAGGRNYIEEMEPTIAWSFATDDSVYYAEVNPGRSGTVAWIFDIPRDVIPETITIESFDDGQVQLSLPEPNWTGQGTVEWQQ